MDKFSSALVDIRENYPQLFDEPALQLPPERDLVVPVSSIDIPTYSELKAFQERDMQMEMEYESTLENADVPPVDYDEPWSIEPDMEDFAAGDRAIKERRDFGTQDTQVGIELLAIYLPFHFYPDGAWGVRFFERPVLQFTKVVNYWSFDNPVTRSPTRLEHLFRDLAGKGPGAYGEAAIYDNASIRILEDRLASQVNQIVTIPGTVPRLWGQLPRPYVQPWTRYENVD